MSVMRTLRDVIDHHAEARPDTPFLFAPEPGTVITYGELRESSYALAGLLADAGIVPGEVVSFMLPNGGAAATLLLGTMVAGYVVSPLNLLAQDLHLGYTLAHSDTRFVFAAPEFVERIRRLLSTVARPGSTWCRPLFRICSTDRISRPRRSMPAATFASGARRRHRCRRSSTRLSSGASVFR